MQKSSLRKSRLALLCLGASVLALSPAMASSFSVGGGTITTTNNDGAADLTGTGGPFILSPNSGGTAGDVITITGVSITNTDNSVTGRAIDIGGLNPSTNSYSVVAHGNTLQGSDNAGLWIGNNGGTISFDSTGGSANHVSGPLGIMVINTAIGGNVSIKTGADIITTNGAFAGEVLNGTANGTGTVSIDSAGATLTGGGANGIVAQTGSGAITIGALNGGIASTINVVNGDGIHASSSSSIINITLASAGTITAHNGIWVQGNSATVDLFGTVTASNDAINAAFSGPLFATLEQGSHVSGLILGSGGDDAIKLVSGTNIAGASFDGGGGADLMILTGSGAGALDVSSAVNFAAIEKDGSGTWTLTRSGGAGIGGAPVALNAGNLVIGTNALSGNVVSAAGTSLQFDLAATGTYAGVISGGASVMKTGSGLLILSGSNTYAGGTTVSAGTLQLGATNALPAGGALAINGGTFDLSGFSQSVGALSGTGGGIAFGGGQLTATNAADATLDSVLSGGGTFVKAGAGTLTLTGTSSFTGTTNLNAGRLNVAGSLAASNISVGGGATLSGTGRVGSVAVANGGTLSPGVGAPGTLSVAGNLALSPGAIYIDNLSPSGVGLTNVSGSAVLNGSLVANTAAGTYNLNQRYTLLTASGGVSGTFASFSTPGLPGGIKAAVNYDAQDVFLTLIANALSPLLPANATQNQRAVAGGIDAATQGGANLPAGFGALFGLSGAQLGGALDQLSGEIGPDASRAAQQAFAPFLDLLTRVDNRPGGSGIVSAMGASDNIKPAQLSVGAVRIWGAAYGGHASFGADPVSGAQRLSVGNVGGAAGIETSISDNFLIGGSVAGGSDTFSLGGDQSRGASTDLMLGLYAQAKVTDQAYISGALAYGWHNISTRRTVTVAGLDMLRAGFVADDFGGRIEGGYKFGMDDGTTLTPYLAFAGQNFSAPAYGETALSGSSAFALSYAAHDSGSAHSELGARVARDFTVGADMLCIDLHSAWAHQIQDDVTSPVSFQNVAGSSFLVRGAQMPGDSGLLGMGLGIRSDDGVTGGARVEGQFGSGITAVFGAVSLGYAW